MLADNVCMYTRKNPAQTFLKSRLKKIITTESMKSDSLFCGCQKISTPPSIATCKTQRNPRHAPGNSRFRIKISEGQGYSSDDRTAAAASVICRKPHLNCRDVGRRLGEGTSDFRDVLVFLVVV